MYGVKLFEEMCVGCRSCMVACQAVRGLAAVTAPLKIKIEEEADSAGDLRLRFSAEACCNCEDAPCAGVCPTVAITREDDGRVVIDEEECTNCGACVDECPFDAVKIDEECMVAVKCDLCTDRVAAGLKPACVAACPGKAIYSGEIEQIDTEIKSRRKAFIEARKLVDTPRQADRDLSGS